MCHFYKNKKIIKKTFIDNFHRKNLELVLSHFLCSQNFISDFFVVKFFFLQKTLKTVGQFAEQMLILSSNFGCEQIYKIREITFWSPFVIKLKSGLDVQQINIWSHFVMLLKSDLDVKQTKVG